MKTQTHIKLCLLKYPGLTQKPTNQQKKPTALDNKSVFFLSTLLLSLYLCVCLCACGDVCVCVY